ncbi:hypothetical protein B273_0265 [SAR86 cluster bacterium SAR86E]|uniref:Uncharacterized protein n=1 Tax=SAR86 cluster bacterium SAR86E TaxID=1208365 RepID=K6GJE6_9GAMM|nr:hypothetical protein B273_0265 [SAR86 cluster bacterium SAR86E]
MSIKENIKVVINSLAIINLLKLSVKDIPYTKYLAFDTRNIK